LRSKTDDAIMSKGRLFDEHVLEFILKHEVSFKR